MLKTCSDTIVGLKEGRWGWWSSHEEIFLLVDEHASLHRISQPYEQLYPSQSHNISHLSKVVTLYQGSHSFHKTSQLFEEFIFKGCNMFSDKPNVLWSKLSFQGWNKVYKVQHQVTYMWSTSYTYNINIYIYCKLNDNQLAKWVP